MIHLSTEIRNPLENRLRTECQMINNEYPSLQNNHETNSHIISWSVQRSRHDV